MLKRYTLLVLRILFGIVFIFSGLSKAIDPLGTSYKIADYLTAWHIQMPEWTTLSASVLLSAIEFLLGLNILFAVRLKESTIAAFIFMCIMTPLTLWIAIANPVSDCGCFGDALVIGNWTTFWKNIILLIIIITIWCLNSAAHNWTTGLTSWLIATTFFMFSLVVSVYSLKHLPFVDFRPYKIGANIIDGMQLQEGEEPDQYESYFIYERNGEEKRFQLQDVPYNDSTWKFVSQHTELVKKGASPRIHDFNIYTEDGDELTDDILQAQNKTYLIVMYDLDKSNWRFEKEMKELQSIAQHHGDDIMILTASNPDVIDHYRKTYSITIPFRLTDPITLKTMIRANPGVVVLQNATVVDKWNLRDQKKHLNN